MQGEFGDKDPHPSPPTIFSNVHHRRPPPPPHFAVTHHQVHLTNTSQEANSKKEFNTTNDGASVEVVRRPRGRPPGSKNKPKPPVVITREPDSCMSPYVLELAGGTDIVAAVTRFCNHRNTGLCLLSGSGTVSNVSFRQPSTTITFHGCFDLLSISATVLPSSSPSSAVLTPFASGFTISLAGPQGQTLGGVVAGPLLAAGTVHIIAASFNNPLYHRLPMEEDNHVRSSGGGSSTAAREQSPGSGGGDSGGHRVPPSTAADSLSMDSCHLPSNVIWAPTPRQGPPHPPLY